MPWKKRVLGREWKTYQTKAAVAVSTARVVLSGRAMTSNDRSQLLMHLYWQLQRSVEKAATLLRKWIGGPENAGIYAGVFSPFPKVHFWRMVKTLKHLSFFFAVSAHWPVLVWTFCLSKR